MTKLNASKLPDSVFMSVAKSLGYDGDKRICVPQTIVDEIEMMSPQQVAGAWAQWHLGSKQWADDILRVYVAAQDAKV